MKASLSVRSFRSLRTIMLMSYGIFLLTGSLQAQVNVSGSTGANGAHATLAAAFTAINGSAQTGNAIVITITGTTTEPAGGATLNGGTWTSVLVQPSGAATIGGAITDGLPLIDLNGADNVTFDGLNSGGNSLTIINSTVSSTPGTSTLRFINDAKTNTITRCALRGCSAVSSNTAGGTVFFSTAAGGGTGNDDNTISFCDIGPVGAALPTKALLSAGSNASFGEYNTGNQLLNNNIFDYFSATTTSNALYIAEGTANMTIANNRFFQTALRTQTVSNSHVVIIVAHPNNSGHTISGNVIGFANSAGTGTYEMDGVGTNSRLNGIMFTAHSATVASSVHGNTIAGIELGGALGGTSIGGVFTGISVLNGLVDIGTAGGNTIGSLTVPNSIVVSFATGGTPEAYGICAIPPLAATVSNNTVGGIQLANTTGNCTLMGIRVSTGGTFTNTLLNNTVGSASAPLVNSSTGIASRSLGIQSQLGIAIMTGNTVSDLVMSAANGSGGFTASLVGMSMEGSVGSSPSTVSQNTVRRLSNTNLVSVNVIGLFFNGPSTVNSTVERNSIHTLATGGVSGVVQGLYASAGTATYANNMVRLGITDAGAADNTGYLIQGITHLAGNATIVHNSVYIGGSGPNDTYALFSAPTTGTRTYRNNILFNAHSSAQLSGHNYAIRVTLVDGVLLSNNNILRASGLDGVVGRVNATNLPTMAQWRTFTGQDPQSLTTDPNYTAPTGAIPDLHISNPTPVESFGAAMGIVHDFDGEVRASLTPEDIGADAGSFTALCSGAPAAGTSSGPATACANEQPVFTNNAVNTSPGVVYTWYVSTSSASGPWSVATGTGVNTQSYTTDPLPGGTRYIVLSAECTNTGDSALSNVITLVVGGPACNVGVVIRIALEGSYNPSTGLMSDALRSAGLVPATEPYTAMGYSYVGHTGGTTTPAVLALTGADAVHDWVVVELRSAGNPAIIMASRSALLQRDGQLADVDNLSPLTFNAPPDNYHVAVRHRNHLGAMTTVAFALTPTPIFLDMAAPGFGMYGTAAVKPIPGTFPAQALWAGDVNFNGQLKYAGSNNDRDPILTAIGGLVPTNTLSGQYRKEDINMNGQVKYAGSANDRDILLQNIGGSVPTAVRNAQLP